MKYLIDLVKKAKEFVQLEFCRNKLVAITDNGSGRKSWDFIDEPADLISKLSDMGFKMFFCAGNTYVSQMWRIRT